MLIITAATTNTAKLKTVLAIFHSVIGIIRGRLLAPYTSHLYRSGGKMYAQTTTVIIPTIVSSASERIAGCFAKISIPTATKSIVADSTIDTLNLSSILRR